MCVCVCVCVCVCARARVCVYVDIPANGKPNNPLGVMKLKCIVSMIAICAQGEVYVRTYTRSESHEYVKKKKKSVRAVFKCNKEISTSRTSKLIFVFSSHIIACSYTMKLNVDPNKQNNVNKIESTCAIITKRVFLAPSYINLWNRTLVHVMLGMNHHNKKNKDHARDLQPM
jgi:hypothetical protein